ncbi:MAG TPA: type I DNA topoisomerase, partial [Actinomycetota bacterium]|nr:type I DNA topoisomerase [Actinomycetota bacterium]
MAKQLVVVESPTKAKTLERYLGPEFRVAASKGHVRDLPEDRFGVNTHDSFQPEYVLIPQKKQVVEELKRAFRRSAGLWLATDFDREGEAIAWHITQAIGADPERVNRVTFTEITRDAVQEAFRHPRRIDLHLVSAQQARRILDRIVGYELSPLLSRRLRRALSAGRVQSVALRLIVDREREIQNFVPQEYWTIGARLTPDGEELAFVARLVQVGEEKLAPSPEKKGLVLRTEAETREHADRLRAAAYRVAEVRRREVRRTPPPPFTTSTLQQEAARKLGFSARKTMQLAQRLYEGVEVPGEGQVGLITYMRTDSVNVAEPALRELAEVVRAQFGPDYALPRPRRYRTRARGAQEAHEAIRPTSARRLPDDLERVLERDHARLYRLIWQRAVASQMTEARFDQTSVDVEALPREGPRYLLRATGQVLVFDGFRRVYWEGRDDGEEEAEALLPELTAGQVLRLLDLLPEQHFTQPPPRYTEATLVKALEEHGIGRPSTYAPTISTLLDRGYVRLEDRRFYPEDIGVVVTDLLVEFFPDVFDVGFTARMEEELDRIAEGRASWLSVLNEFYEPFRRDLKVAEDEMEPPEEELDELCPRCPEEGRAPGRLVVRLGRYGRFVGCRNYPECTYTREVSGEERPEPELLDEACPECGRPLQRRVGRYGPFVGCSGYPECRYVRRERRGTGIACPECREGELVERRGRYGPFYSCSRYPECRFSVNQTPLPEPCPACQGLVVAARGGARRCTACGRAWDAEGRELPEGEARALAAPRRARSPRG